MCLFVPGKAPMIEQVEGLTPVQLGDKDVNWSYLRECGWTRWFLVSS